MAEKTTQEDIFIHPTASVSSDAVVGTGSQIWDFVKIREGVRIGSRCSLGHAVYIDCGVQLGDGVKVQNGANIYRGVTIENNVFIGPNAVFTNDHFPRAAHWDDTRLGYTIVEAGASIGANATIVCGSKEKPRKIGKFAMIGAGAVITQNVPAYCMMSGVPARLIGFVTESGHPVRELSEIQTDFVVLKHTSSGESIRIPRLLYERWREEKA